MNIISPGKFEITLAGETKVVLVSLGLKAEFYGLITQAQIEQAGLESSVLLDPELGAAITAKDKEIKDLEATEDYDKEKFEQLQKELEEVYATALLDLEKRQKAKTDEAAIARINATETSFAKLISCLLSERDDCGKIINKLPLEVILWSQEYAEAQEELVDLVHAVVEYITSALKKISEISQMVQGVSKAAVPPTP